MVKKWYTTDNPLIYFEDTSVGKLKNDIWDASEEEIDKILADYEIPSPSELGKAGCYIKNTPRAKCIEKRQKNDILFLPIGCTENHGLHANSGLDTFMVTQILEAFPAGKVPPVDKVTLRTPAEMEPYLKEPFSEGWKSVYELPHIGPFHKG